jgi:hypothetical protein
VRTIVEVKKDGSVPDNATLAKRYAGQASGYLTTGASFGFLLVLDLTERADRSQISETKSVLSERSPMDPVWTTISWSHAFKAEGKRLTR